MPRDPRIGVGTAVFLINDREEFLLMQRAGSHAAGSYALPGGWMDYEDATPKNGACRELQEELGIQIPSISSLLFLTISHEAHEKDGDRFKSITIYYVCYTRWAGEPTIMEPEKCQKLLWHPLGEPAPFPSFSNLEGVRAMLHQRKHRFLI
jgi:8-oxo-dGTP diphosphatase